MEGATKIVGVRWSLGSQKRGKVFVKEGRAKLDQKTQTIMKNCFGPL